MHFRHNKVGVVPPDDGGDKPVSCGRKKRSRKNRKNPRNHQEQRDDSDVVWNTIHCIVAFATWFTRRFRKVNNVMGVSSFYGPSTLNELCPDGYFNIKKEEKTQEKPATKKKKAKKDKGMNNQKNVNDSMKEKSDKTLMKRIFARVKKNGICVLKKKKKKNGEIDLEDLEPPDLAFLYGKSKLTKETTKVKVPNGDFEKPKMLKVISVDSQNAQDKLDFENFDKPKVNSVGSKLQEDNVTFDKSGQKKESTIEKLDVPKVNLEKPKLPEVGGLVKIENKLELAKLETGLKMTMDNVTMKNPYPPKIGNDLPKEIEGLRELDETKIQTSTPSPKLGSPLSENDYFWTDDSGSLLSVDIGNFVTDAIDNARDDINDDKDIGNLVSDAIESAKHDVTAERNIGDFVTNSIKIDIVDQQMEDKLRREKFWEDLNRTQEIIKIADEMSYNTICAAVAQILAEEANEDATDNFMDDFIKSYAREMEIVRAEKMCRKVCQTMVLNTLDIIGRKEEEKSSITSILQKYKRRNIENATNELEIDTGNTTDEKEMPSTSKFLKYENASPRPHMKVTQKVEFTGKFAEYSAPIPTSSCKLFSPRKTRKQPIPEQQFHIITAEEEEEILRKATGNGPIEKDQNET